MPTIETNRRTLSRCASRAGGRRATDRPSGDSDPPTCPKCHTGGVAVVAGEAEGGWWFVCLACDHLWDERQRGCAG